LFACAKVVETSLVSQALAMQVPPEPEDLTVSKQVKCQGLFDKLVPRVGAMLEATFPVNVVVPILTRQVAVPGLLEASLRTP
jgi:hypothetical protein